MCAINGITANDTARVTLMNEATKHRGPDGTHVWNGDGITLGHNRLAIIDLSDRALQPMRSNDGRYTIVFNGEIYNYLELRKELEHTYQFKTESDTEVLIAAYSTWGEEMFPRLRGMFAFGLWDTKTHSLLLARDHAGMKPLYYRVDNNVLSFSSEMPALMLVGESRTLDLTSLGFYLSMEYVPSPRTLVSEIKKLPSGHILQFENSTLNIRSYIKTSFETTSVEQANVYSTIDTAVKRHLVSDRPVGAYLSGGFDSSIVTHHMLRHSNHVRTYSVDFEPVAGEEADSIKFNADARLAEKTAAIFGTEHKTFTITLDDIRTTIETACASANEPVANSTAITQFLLSDFVRKDGTVVVLGGDGGDELFGGYTRHRIAMSAYVYQQLPSLLRKVGSGISPRLSKLETPFFTPLHKALMVKDEKKILLLLQKNLPINTSVTDYFDQHYAPYTAMHKEVHPLDIFMRVDRATWLPDECFIRSDYASMAHGLELRVPFADPDVVQMSDHVSIWKKVLPHEGKRIIRETYRPYLPKHLYGQPKRGWLSPAAKWFRDPVINQLVTNVLSPEYYDGLSELYNWSAIQTLLRDHVDKKTYALYPLWNLLVLQIWARKNGVRIG